MARASVSLTLPASLMAAAGRLAKQDGVSLNHWITVAVAQKIGAVETAADFVKQRARSAEPEDMLPFLERAGQEMPSLADEFGATGKDDRLDQL